MGIGARAVIIILVSGCWYGHLIRPFLTGRKTTTRLNSCSARHYPALCVQHSQTVPDDPNEHRDPPNIRVRQNEMGFIVDQFVTKPDCVAPIENHSVVGNRS